MPSKLQTFLISVMKLYKCIILFALLTSSIVARGAIYRATRPFTTPDEHLYSKWIKEVVSQDIFSNPTSPYYGIKTDCADAAFALRAIFSYEHKLSFQFIDNEGASFSERTTKFDHVSTNEVEKLKVFIDYIAENVGSEVLASDNTYPIELKALRAGDLYITRWANTKRQLTRHVYIIKEILPTGDLLLYSSTAPRAIRPLLPRKGMPLKIFKEGPFGFRRFQPWPNTPITELEDYSNMQYEAVKLGEEKFFKLAKEGLKSSEDSLELNIKRRLENICVALTARLDIVEIALEAKEELQTQCFEKAKYDELSTPSRDKNIIQDIQRLRNAYKVIVSKGMIVDLSETTKNGLDYLIDENKTDEGLTAIKGLCSIPIEISPERRVLMTIKTFYDRYNADLISSNPNEGRAVRWGLEKSKNICTKL